MCLLILLQDDCFGGGGGGGGGDVGITVRALEHTLTLT